MQTTPGFLLKQFPSQQEYKETVEYAKALGVLVWRNDERLCFFASRVEQLSAYLRNKSARDASR
jgi:transcription initiation factor TFIIH subunit 4